MAAAGSVWLSLSLPSKSRSSSGHPFSACAPPPRRLPLYYSKTAGRSVNLLLCTCSSSSAAAVVTDDAAADAVFLSYKDDPNFRGCRGCGRDSLEPGCNGEGRIQGGIAAVPGFGWWPIKAYRPCPGFLASGGRYRRQGQSMDDVASGTARRRPNKTPPTPAASSSKTKNKI